VTRRVEVRGMEGVRFCINALSVSHLLFGDDYLILMKAYLTNATSATSPILCKLRKVGE
jgi:hypothetical protein